MVTKVRERRSCIGVRQKTKDGLDSIKHPGQSYYGVIQVLIELWKKEHGVAESASTTQE